MNKILVLLLVMTSLIGCSSIARVSDFETEASLIDFKRFDYYQPGPSRSGWTWNGNNEYFFTVAALDKEDFSQILKNAVDSMGYSVVKVSDDGSAIIGKKGIRFSDWGSVIGVYFSESKDGFGVYVKVRITQDITGGFIENRAKEFSEYFCSESGICN